MNLRKDNKGEALKAWKKLGPAHIAKPLRHIGNRTNSRGKDGHVIFSEIYLAAMFFALIGDGQKVQHMALALKR